MDQRLGQLGAHHHRYEDGDDEGALDHQRQARRLVGQRAAGTHAERVQGDQDDGLDGDAAKNVADGDVEVVGRGCADGDRDLGQVGRDREQDQPAERRPEVQPVGQHVGAVAEPGAGDPDHHHADDEDDEVGRERHPGQQVHEAAPDARRSPPGSSVSRTRANRSS